MTEIKKIRLTAQRYGLGCVDMRHKLVNYDYTIQNNDFVFITDEARAKATSEYGRYEAWAYMSVPNRKREIHVMIGFDEYGNYYRTSVNFGKGNIPKKIKIQLLNTLIEWLIADGWGVTE